MVKSSNTKSRKRAVIIFEWLSLLLLALAGIVFFVNHALAIFSIPLLLGGLVCGAFALRLALINNGAKHSSANGWCLIVTIPSCVLCGYLLLLEIWPEQQSRKPIPHFVLALRIGDSVSATVLLTNDFLFESHFTNTAVLPSGSFLLRGHSSGCLIIPVTPGETNKVFTFIFENDSRREISDLEGAVGFPTGWHGRLDPKWKKTETSLFIPKRFQISFTNLQFWSADCPWTLYPFDQAEFPAITNPCTIEHTGNSFKEGFFVLMPRAAGWESWISANVLFFPVASNTFKPFIAKEIIGKGGKYRLSLTREQLQKLQK